MAWTNQSVYDALVNRQNGERCTKRALSPSVSAQAVILQSLNRFIREGADFGIGAS
jgi:hypothetical protein